MPPDSDGPGGGEDWLRHARSDLALASAVGPVGDILAETLCFHAQQAAEKALKAESVVGLTDYAVTTRYPGETEPVDPAELEESIRLAQAVSAAWKLTAEIEERRRKAETPLLQRQLGLNRYETVWTMLNKLRRAMVTPNRDTLRGIIEVDETYISGLEHRVTI